MTAGDWKRRLEEWLAENQLVNIIPEVAALKDIPQPPEFHPEGDVLTHTLQAVAEVADKDDERVFWTVLLHDIGKAHTTCFHDGRWRSHGHAGKSAEMARTILKKLGLENLSDDVCWLVKNHHYHHAWNLPPGQPLSRRQQKFTEHPLFRLLLKVCAADSAGRKVNGKSPFLKGDFKKLLPF
jgi:putative nucleotidyltransferase with HDIG domain